MSEKKCKYCIEEISTKAKVCHHCGRHQNRFIQYSDRVGIIISFGLLIISIYQLDRANQEHIKAQNALEIAKKTENRIKESSKSLAKALLVLSNIDGTIDNLDALQFFPALKGQADTLLDTIEITHEEKEEIYKPYYLIQKWSKEHKKRIDSKKWQPSVEEKKLENKIKQEINR